MSKRWRIPENTPTLQKALPPLPEKPMTAGKALVTLDVFARLSGLRADHFAGFAHWARRNLPPKLTLEAWRENFGAFQKKPVR